MTDTEMNEGYVELELEELNEVSGGKRIPCVRAMGKNVNVRKGPGMKYPVLTQLAFLQEVPANGEVVYDEDGSRWAKVKVTVGKNDVVVGWVSSKFAEGFWRNR